jgi:hypothetical protein
LAQGFLNVFMVRSERLKIYLALRASFGGIFHKRGATLHPYTPGQDIGGGKNQPSAALTQEVFRGQSTRLFVVRAQVIGPMTSGRTFAQHLNRWNPVQPGHGFAVHIHNIGGTDDHPYSFADHLSDLGRLKIGDGVGGKRPPLGFRGPLESRFQMLGNRGLNLRIEFPDPQKAKGLHGGTDF